MTITYLTREEWGADASLPRRGYQINGAAKFRRIFNHHTVMVMGDWDGDGIVHGDLDDIKRYMQTLQTIRPDLGLDVPYSFVVFQGIKAEDSVVCEGRGLNRTGAHTAGFNSKSLGVAYAANTELSVVTAGMIAGVRWCGSLLDDQGSMLPALGHGAVKATACPGHHAKQALGRIQPPFANTYEYTYDPATAPANPQGQDDMITLIDTRDNEGWVCVGTKARKISDLQSWVEDWKGTVHSDNNMRYIVRDLYTVV